MDSKRQCRKCGNPEALLIATGKDSNKLVETIVCDDCCTVDLVWKELPLTKYCPACGKVQDYDEFNSTFDHVSHICKYCEDFERDMEIMAEYQAGGFDDYEMAHEGEAYSETIQEMETE